jgi:hypothetical protein
MNGIAPTQTSQRFFRRFVFGDTKKIRTLGSLPASEADDAAEYDTGFSGYFD